MNNSVVVNSNYRTLAEGVTVSNDIMETRINNNDLIIGGSGSGKTGGYIFKLLENPNGSLIVSDTKGQLHKIFSEHLKALGYKVEVLDFVHPEKSVPYNPLRYIDVDKSHLQSNDMREHIFHKNGRICEKDIKKLAYAIVPSLLQDDLFWEKSAARFIAILIGICLAAFPEEEQNMNTVLKIYRSCRSPEAYSDFDVNEWAENHPNSFAAKKYMEMKNTEKSNKTWNSIMEFVNEALDPFGYEDFAPLFGGTDSFDITSLGKEKTVLFLNSSDNDPSFHILCDIFHTQALQALIREADKHENGKLDVPVRIVLDDFAASSKINNFDNMISIIRSREISVSVIIQSLSQLKSKYDENICYTILNNCDHILYLAGHDYDTASFIAQHINKTVHSVLSLPQSQAILITEGADTQIVNKLKPYYSENPDLLAKLARGQGERNSHVIRQTNGKYMTKMELENYQYSSASEKKKMEKLIKLRQEEAKERSLKEKSLKVNEILFGAIPCVALKDYVRTSLDAPIETRAEREERLYEEALFQYQIDTFFNEQEWYDADYDDDYEDDYEDDEYEAEDASSTNDAEEFGREEPMLETETDKKVDLKSDSKIKNS